MSRKRIKRQESSVGEAPRVARKKATKNPTSRKRTAKNPAAKSFSARNKLVAAFALGTILIASTAMLAQLKSDRTSIERPQVQGRPATEQNPNNLTPANLSKEYVYGPGGRLVASEEPNALSPTLQSFAASGGTGSFNVSVASGTTWSANSNASWITINSGGSGTGNGTVNYSVGTNTINSIRNGTITVSGQTLAAQTFTAYQGKDFADVPSNNAYYTYIGKLVARSVTVGCDTNNYCPNSIVTREQMATFICRALGDPNPPTPATQRFTDVPPSNIFYNFIEQMAVRRITVGCGGGNYCPSSSVLHEQMATFIMRALAAFNPPTPPSQRFPDVPSSNSFYNFIDAYAARGIWNGGNEDWTGHPDGACSPGNFCPSKGVSRAQMAKILVNAFNL